jgi:hypothetical protein
MGVMSKPTLTDLELRAFLEESLPESRMAAIEADIRHDPALAERAALLIAERDSGVHSVGEIWRRHRLSCPSRERLVAFHQQEVDSAEATYIQFHLGEIGCIYCQANLADISTTAEDQRKQATPRRQRLFEKSAPRLRKPKKE